MTFLKPVCYLALCLALIVGTPLAAQTAEDEGCNESLTRAPVYLPAQASCESAATACMADT